MDQEELTALVVELLATKREDDWWDFKQKHQHDKAELVHDIICMANNRPRRDSYIIFGVEDKTLQIIGVESDTNRRNQQGITDILRSVSFAGGIRPRIEVHTIVLENRKLDVLVIKDSAEVPYYLENDYRDKCIKNQNGKLYGKIVRAYHIYTRVVDNNTAIDKQADFNDIEFLWRKRFGIDLSIMERFNRLLDDTDKWVFDWGNKKYCYHIDFPEFQIVQMEDMQQGWVPAAAFYAHPVMYLARLNVMYHNTTIYESVLWSFDEFRKYLPEARNSGVKNKMDFWYSYYLLDSIEGKMLKIFTHRSCDISSRESNYHQILIFENEDQKKEFDMYVFEHFDDHSEEEINDKYKYQIQEDKKENLGGLKFSAYQVAKIAWLYEDWRSWSIVDK